MIERDFSLRPVVDFRKNVEPKLNSNNVAVEVYSNGIVIGWNIEPLINTSNDKYLKAFKSMSSKDMKILNDMIEDNDY